MNWPMIGAVIQGVTLLVLAATVYVAYRQLKTATAQARASDAQAKSSEQMARLSLQQTELMCAQLHAAFRPVVEVVGGEYGVNNAMLTLQNVGNSPALTLTAICRSGYRERLGALGPDQQRRFKFEGSFNLPQQVIGPPEYREKFKPEIQPVPLRLEYTSVSGAMCWTNINFPLGRQGVVDPEIEHGMDLPAITLPQSAKPN